MFELVPLNHQNFSHFIELLKERGETPEPYYRWKYLDQPSLGKPTGFIAYLDNRPVGCIGIVNRTYRAPNGNEVLATWFADWFVNRGARGKGIGEALMNEVRKVAPSSFGIPGPAKAQLICKRSGYSLEKGLHEHSLYLNPVRCGFRRFSGSFIVRFLRGVKSMLASLPVQRKLLFTRNSLFFENGFVQENRWRTLPSLEKGHLIRSYDFIKWFMDMPTSPQAQRSWWSIVDSEVFAFGFVETDFWGLRKAVIVDMHFQFGEEAVWKIAATLWRHGADWISFSYFDNNLVLKYWKRIVLPLHVATSYKLDSFHITDFDKDSSWRNLLFVL